MPNVPEGAYNWTYRQEAVPGDCLLFLQFGQEGLGEAAVGPHVFDKEINQEWEAE